MATRRQPVLSSCWALVCAMAWACFSWRRKTSAGPWQLQKSRFCFILAPGYFSSWLAASSLNSFGHTCLGASYMHSSRFWHLVCDIGVLKRETRETSSFLTPQISTVPFISLRLSAYFFNLGFGSNFVQTEFHKKRDRRLFRQLFYEPIDHFIR